MILTMVEDDGKLKVLMQSKLMYQSYLHTSLEVGFRRYVLEHARALGLKGN